MNDQELDQILKQATSLLTKFSKEIVELREQSNKITDAVNRLTTEVERLKN